MPFYLTFLLLLLLFLPATAAAEDGFDLSQAGGEEHFRVIDRFPDGDTSSSDDADTDGDPLDPVVEHVLNEQWDDAFDLLSSDLSDVLDARPEVRFLAGYTAHRAEQHEAALSHFDALDGELVSLGDYRSYFAARAAFEDEDFHRATVLAASVDDDSRFHADALFLLARALEESGENEDLRRAADVLELYLDNYSSNSDVAAARLLLGEVRETLGRHDDAARVYLKLRDEHPLSSESNTATERLEGLSDEIDDALAERIDEDSIDRTMRKYRALHSRHRSERIVDELPDRIDEFPDGEQSKFCEALYTVADSHTKLRRHGDAIPWYDRVLDECADVENYEIRALYRTARSRWNDGDRQGALEVYERLLDGYPDHSFADDAKYFTARILRSEDRKDEAREVLRRQVERYPDGDMLKDAHWLLVRDFFEREDYAGAVDYVDGVENTGEDDLYTRGRLAYFRGRALELKGESDEAHEALVKVAEDYPMSYYALLAFNRLGRLEDAGDDICDEVESICDRLLADDTDARPVDIPDRLQEDEAFERGMLLLSLGLNGHARSEFSILRRRHSGDSLLWAMAHLLDRAGAYPISHDIARRHIHGWQDSYPDGTTRIRWEIAYPNPFDDEVQRWANERGLAPGYVYAVMREESGFRPRVESWANAKGLLQLLDDTARRMASRDGFDGYSFDRLADPEVNVRLGTAYMEHLRERLADHPVLSTAGYNAGSGNVANWLDSFGDQPVDLFVEDIPFHQTRNYAKRVMQSFWIYSYLYGEQRVPRVGFDLR